MASDRPQPPVVQCSFKFSSPKVCGRTSQEVNQPEIALELSLREFLYQVTETDKKLIGYAKVRTDLYMQFIWKASCGLC